MRFFKKYSKIDLTSYFDVDIRLNITTYKDVLASILVSNNIDFKKLSTKEKDLLLKKIENKVVGDLQILIKSTIEKEFEIQKDQISMIFKEDINTHF